jgi:hypothetical protein
VSRKESSSLLGRGGCQVPSEDQIFQSVEFKGKPGTVASAMILKGYLTDLNDSSSLTSPALIVVHKYSNSDSRYYNAAWTEALDLSIGGMAGTESSLSVARNGSLQINTKNESVGSFRYSRTFTVAFRHGQYQVVGFTYEY